MMTPSIEELESELDRLDEEVAAEIIKPKVKGSILDDRLPHRFGNRARRRKMQSEIRKLK